MKKLIFILSPFVLLILSFIVYSNFLYVKKLPIIDDVPESTVAISSEVIQSTETNTVPSEVPFDGSLNTDLDESFDEAHQGSLDEIFIETPSGVYVENILLVKDSLSNVAYSALIVAFDSGEYGEKLKILERSLIVSNHIIKFSVINQDSMMYLIVANNNDATINISLF